ncbi:MAG: S49 family peptidase [Bdellovibrionales bacterium]
MILPHIAGRIFSTPLMISHAKLEVILGVIAPRLQGDVLPPKEGSGHSRSYQITPDGIAIIPILGTLVRRTMGLEALSGLTSYAEVSAQIAQAVSDMSVRAILLDIDSPGGEASGVFDLADQIYAARQTKPVWAVANEESFSAAYILASAAEKIYVSRTAGVGSIGVIAVHLDQSQADEDEGLKYTAVFAGKRKNDYSQHEPLSDPARTALQVEVDRIYNIFVQDVADRRGVTPAAIRKTEAALFFGEEAVAAGLADTLGTFDDAMNDLAASLSLQPSIINRKVNSMSKPKETPSVQTEESPLEPQMSTEALVERAKVEAHEKAMAYVKEVNDLCAIAGMTEKANAFISKAVPVADIRQVLLETKVKQAEATEISGHVPTPMPSAEAKIDTAAIYAARNKTKGV